MDAINILESVRGKRYNTNLILKIKVSIRTMLHSRHLAGYFTNMRKDFP